MAQGGVVEMHLFEQKVAVGEAQRRFQGGADGLEEGLQARIGAIAGQRFEDVAAQPMRPFGASANERGVRGGEGRGVLPRFRAAGRGG